MAATHSFDPADPRHLTPEQRADELTAVLAAGVRRLLALRADCVPSPPPPTGPPLSESSQNCLDGRPETRLHVSRRVNAHGESRNGVER